MIKYNPKDWFSLIFEFHKSDTLRKMMYVLIIYGFYSLAIVYIELDYIKFRSTISIHSLVGFVLGLLLVFRTNTAYERWWEGRKLLGALVNTSRNLALKVDAFLPKDASAKRTFFAEMISNYCFSMKNHLRDKRIASELVLSNDLTEDKFNSIDHLPNLIAEKIYGETKNMYNEKIITDNIYITIDNQVKEFTDIIGGCERIKKTPIPYSYNIFIKKIIFIYTMTLPIGLATTFEYWAIPISLFVLYVLVSLELLAEEIEDPFGEDTNDLPVDEICHTIKKNVEEILMK
jgi:putative membrane protein